MEDERAEPFFMISKLSAIQGDFLLNSVKILRETELLFLKTDSLSEFKFPDYQSNISPDFLIYADIEIQLDVLDKKALELLHRGHTLVGTEASWVVLFLRNSNQLSHALSNK